MTRLKPRQNLPDAGTPVLGYWKASGRDKEQWAIVTIETPGGESWLVCDGGVYDVWTHCDAPDLWFDLPELDA